MSETTGWKRARKTINGREYVIGTKWIRGGRYWFVYCDGWKDSYCLRLADAKRAAHKHAREIQE